jgi:hypothetical protein
MSDSIDKVKPTTLVKLLSEPEPFLTVQILNNVAFECETSYSEIIRYVQKCRNNGESMNQCVIKIVKTFRPELLD